MCDVTHPFGCGFQAIIDSCFAAEPVKRVFVPRVVGPHMMTMYEVESSTEASTFPLNKCVLLIVRLLLPARARHVYHVYMAIRWKIREPPITTSRGDPRATILGLLEDDRGEDLAPILIVVPGVGFDATGRRLGYGGGFYGAWHGYIHSFLRMFLTMSCVDTFLGRLRAACEESALATTTIVRQCAAACTSCVTV